MKNNLFYLTKSALNGHKLCLNIIRKSSSHNLNKKIVFSGIQPTGIPHLGNYFGAIELWKNLQGQSDVLEHAHLCWILSCHFTMNALSRLPAFREKSEKLDAVPVGLFLYPCLQAADILVYKTNLVPIGKDNLANLHLAQDIIDKLNTIYNSNLPKPEVLMNEEVACIKSLREPDKKMSKSDGDKLSKIMILDEPDDIINKIKKAKTDFTSAVNYDPINRPGVSNLLLLHSLISKKSIDELINESSNLNTGQYKLILGEQLVEFLKPIRLKANAVINDKSYLDSILKNGSDKARAIASKTLDEISNLLGLK